MKPQVTPIRLNSDLTLAHEERLVKRGALAFFRAVRVVVTQSREVPGIVHRAADDIRAAWQESARPNA